MLNIICNQNKLDLFNIFNQKLVNLLLKKQELNKNCIIGLSGGKTPLPFYNSFISYVNEKLKNYNIKNIFFILSDERHAPLNSTESNYYNIINAFNLNNLIIDQIIPLKINYKIPKLISEDYEKNIFNLIKNNDNKLDLLILGMGLDQHIASIFTKSLSSFLNLNDKIFISHFVSELNTIRYTLTLNFILNSKDVMLIIIGNDKENVLQNAILDAQNHKLNTPAKILINHFLKNNEQLLTILTDIKITL